jgi:hypothetical protein
LPKDQQNDKVRDGRSQFVPVSCGLYGLLVIVLKGHRPTMLVSTHEDETKAPLPHVVAEALVRRLSTSEVIERAKAVGLPETVVETAIKVCGCGKKSVVSASGAR